MELKTMKLTELKPYPNNPRKNDNAVEAVAESIKQCGYVAPIVVDEDFVILAGHTRYKALKTLGRKETQVIVREGLTEEQKRKYRLLDNKTGELAEWDFDLLPFELEGLDFGTLNLDWGVVSPDDYDEDFELPDGEKEPFVTMSFTLANEQAALIKASMESVGECRETFGNQNSNGNALYEVVRQWATSKK